MNTQTEVTDDRVLRNMSKGGPQTRPNQAVYQRRMLANGGKGGSADPTWQPLRLSFGGKLDPII